MSYYSRKGDDGTTGWLGKGRLPKTHLRIETLGAIDEASSALGVAPPPPRGPPTAALLLEAQRDLYAVMAEASTAPDDAAQLHFDRARVEWLEKHIDELAGEVPAPAEFIVPGDTQAGAALDMARTVVRRAERRMLDLLQAGMASNPALHQYLNRLSSLLFVLELVENKSGGRETSRAKR